MRRYLLLFTVLVIVTSCSVQKRRYQKGFYVNRLHQKESAVKQNAQASTRKSEGAVNREEVPAILRTGEILLEAGLQNASPASIRKSLAFKDQQDTCDILLFKDGSELRVKVSEIGPDDIKYKRCESPDGPFYITRKTDLFMIKYANGTREVIKAPQQVEPSPTFRQYNYKQKPRVVHPMAPVALVSGALSIIVAYIGLILAAGIGIFPPILFLIIILLPVIAVVTGKTALNRIREQPDVYKGKGLAIPGFIMGLVMLGIYAMIALLFLALLGI